MVTDMGNPNIPEIRFKQFTQNWKQKKAKELCSISTGKSNTQDRVADGQYPFYVRSPIIEHSKKYLFDEEAVLTVGDGVGTGKVYHYVNGKYDLHQRVYRMYDFSDEITAKYFYYYFSSHFYDRVMAMTAKTSVDSVRHEMIADMGISLPNIDEQVPISSLFDCLNNLISLYQHKHSQFQGIKKSMLEKMFPKDGSKIPEIRFKGFTGDWEQHNLAEFCDLFNGDRSSKYPNDDDMVSIGIPFINAGDLENGKVNLHNANKITRDKYNQLSGAKLQLGDILYCLRGTLGKNAFIDNFNEGTVASSLVAIRPKGIDGKFLFYILNSNIELKQRIVHDEGAAQPNLSAKSVSEFFIPVPSLLEQQKIATYFTYIDSLITLFQEKSDKLANLKQALISKMFV